MSNGDLYERDWGAIFASAEERGLTQVDAGGINDDAMRRLAKLDCVTHLNVSSNALTDAGLEYLASLPQLIDLQVDSPKITDAGLRVVRQLTRLRKFQCCWVPDVSDAGAENLAFCESLESVDLTGTSTGDGLIRALAGKTNLSRLKTGCAVTDAGIERLHEIPVFQAWRGEDARCDLMSAVSEPNFLQIDGPFTDAGLAGLAGLDGLFGLSFFWHSHAFTAAGLAPLRSLPHLGFLGCQGARCDDGAMRQIAGMPRLIHLMAQGAVAGDEGWRALAKSQTIESIWGRDCRDFTGRGFAALATMPKLRGIAISCKHVDDASLAALPNFPGLREITPIDVVDEGFKHIGRCQNLETLWCMYCRETGDRATEHIVGLPHLKTYYAGKTRITDRSLEMLGGMDSLERIEFWGCEGITEAGLPHLALLPRLREVHVAASPQVSERILTMFPPHVAVEYK